MEKLFVPAEPYPWPYNGALRADNTTLLVVDMQIDFCGPGGFIDRQGCDISLTRAYRLKYGFGLNVDQDLGKGVGIFSRLGCSNGQTEAWMFSDVDRTATLGVTVNQGGTLALDNTAVNVNNRLSSAVANNPTLTLNGGTLNFVGSNVAGSGCDNTNGCTHIILGTQRVWESTNGGLTSWSAKTGDLSKNNLIVGSDNRSYINQIHYSVNDPTVAMVAWRNTAR
jgi:hypothetical protein